MTQIYPVILAGGNGTRLWPSSRHDMPKQFCGLYGKESLFKRTVARALIEDVPFRQPIIITNETYKFIVQQQLLQMGVEDSEIIIEPTPLNTAPAILSACLSVIAADDDAMVLIMPSDHMINDHAAFGLAIKSAVVAAQDNKIVTFGVKPTHPETGFGYLEVGREEDGRVKKIIRFVEKPQLADATSMYQKDNFYWNSGMFFGFAKDIVAAFALHCPEILVPVQGAVKMAHRDLDFLYLNPQQWEKCPSISIDYAIMEKAQNLVAVDFDADWTDLGDWNAVWNSNQPDDNGNVVGANTYDIDCQNVLLRQESDKQILVGLGLDNIVAVATDEAILISDRTKLQAVGKIVDFLQEKGPGQAQHFNKKIYSWGWVEMMTSGYGHQIRKLFLKPDSVIELESQETSAKNWVLIEGVASLYRGDELVKMAFGEAIFAEKGKDYRLQNDSAAYAVIIEASLNGEATNHEMANLAHSKY